MIHDLPVEEITIEVTGDGSGTKKGVVSNWTALYTHLTAHRPYCLGQAGCYLIWVSSTCEVYKEPLSAVSSSNGLTI